MKTFILKLSAFVSVVLLVVTMVFSSSCKKDPMVHGKITVVDTSGVPVSAATVVLSSPTGTVAYSNITDASGVALFDIKLPAIFDIRATKTTLSGLTGKGILRLDEPGKSEDVQVIMKP